MAHFAELDINNVVVRVIVVNNDVIQNLPFPESEAVGVQFCKATFPESGEWKQTSVNNNFRKNFACIGYTYDPVKDAFCQQKPAFYTSWVFNGNTCRWEPPVPRPMSVPNRWSERDLAWIDVPQPYPSWTMQGSPPDWVPPTPMPREGGKTFVWDEPSLSWVENIPSPA